MWGLWLGQEAGDGSGGAFGTSALGPLAFVCCRSCCINLILGFIYSQSVHVSSWSSLPTSGPLVRAPAAVSVWQINSFSGIKWPLSPYCPPQPGQPGSRILPLPDVLCVCAFYGRLCVFAAKHEVKITHTHMANVAQLFRPERGWWVVGWVVGSGWGCGCWIWL